MIGGGAGDWEINGVVAVEELQAMASRFVAELDEGDVIAADRLDALQARLELLERDRDGRLREARNDLGEAMAELREARTQLREIRTQLPETRTQLRETRTQLREARTQLREARIQLRMLEDRCSAASRESAEARERIEAAHHDAEQHLSDLRESRRREAELKLAVAETKSRCGDLDAELDSLRPAARAAAAQARRLEEQVAALLEERKAIGIYADRAARSHAWRIGHRITSTARLLTFRRNRHTSALGRIQERLAQAPTETSGATPTLPAADETNPSEPQR